LFRARVRQLDLVESTTPYAIRILLVAESGASIVTLLSDSWAEFDKLNAYQWLVRPAIPILYFGDLERYRESEVRVITVGLNPSKKEFPETSPYQRFPAASALDRRVEGWEKLHQTALNNYFRADPYTSWFGAWEPVLSGIDASYYAATNVALHTDLCSPLATNPTWTGLDENAKSLLELSGNRLWRALVAVLEPDIVLISVGAQYLAALGQAPLGAWRISHRVEGPTRRPLDIRVTWAALGMTHRSMLVFGRAANLPLGTVSHSDKAVIGRAVHSAYLQSSK
jgi:hypothetical protein